MSLGHTPYVEILTFLFEANAVNNIELLVLPRSVVESKATAFYLNLYMLLTNYSLHIPLSQSYI